MGKTVKDNINFNTVLLILMGAFLTLYVKKADDAFTQIITLRADHNALDKRVGDVESFLGIFTPHKKAKDTHEPVTN